MEDELKVSKIEVYSVGSKLFLHELDAVEYAEEQCQNPKDCTLKHDFKIGETLYYFGWVADRENQVIFPLTFIREEYHILWDWSEETVVKTSSLILSDGKSEFNISERNLPNLLRDWKEFLTFDPEL